ncbi:MAG: hypothetical protein QW254_03490 [Desulfurococcaceae archaeon]
MSERAVKPVLLVTCRSGNTTLCMHEIGNVLFRLDPYVKVEPSKYPGLVMVFSNMDPLRAYRASSMREYGFVENIVPVICSFKGIPGKELLEQCIDKLRFETSNIKIRVKARGIRGVSTSIFREIKGLLLLRGIRHDPGSNTCLYVEIVDEETFIGLGYCHPVFKHS